MQELGLGLALKQLMEQLTRRASLQFTVELPAQINGLWPEVEQQIYRITEEALNNVVQHASAQTVEIHLKQSNSQLCLQIADDGIGFDLNTLPISGHYGLLGMQERASLMGGSLTINSQPQQGTIIQLDIPLNGPIKRIN